MRHQATQMHAVVHDGWMHGWMVWMRDEGYPTLKTSASKSFGMAINVIGCSALLVIILAYFRKG